MVNDSRLAEGFDTGAGTGAGIAAAGFRFSVSEAAG
jgi:hypothetical protein